jgi:DNA-binding transcriptional MerR regulator
MLKIGEFARMVHVSVATLRYYEKVCLLKPAALDPQTGYRFYSLDQLPRLHRLLALKELGFSLQQIARLLEEELTPEHLRDMFALKQAQIQQMIETEQARLTRVAARLHQIEQEGKLPAYEVILKQVDALLVASVREMVPLDRGLEQSYRQSCGKLVSYLRQHGIQPGSPRLVLLHSRSQQRGDGLFLDLETAFPLSAQLPGNEQVSSRMLPGGLMACTIYAGADLFLGTAYSALHSWIQNNRYQIVGPPRLIRLSYNEQMDLAHYVTEVQFPVHQSTLKSS